MPTKLWVDNKNAVPLHSEVSFNHEEIMKCAGKWRELENIMLSEIAQAEKDRDHMKESKNSLHMCILIYLWV